MMRLIEGNTAKKLMAFTQKSSLMQMSSTKQPVSGTTFCWLFSFIAYYSLNYSFFRTVLRASFLFS